MGPSCFTRTTRHCFAAPPIPLAALLLGVVALVTVGGCQPKKGPPTTGPSGTASGTQQLPVRPDWQKFAEENFYGIVQAGLPSGAMGSAKFPKAPQVVASRAEDGKVDLVAVGEVETRSPSGARQVSVASVMWEQRGSGWQMVYRNIGAGAPAPAPVATPTTPVPASRPAAPGAPAPAPGAGGPPLPPPPQ